MTDKQINIIVIGSDSVLDSLIRAQILNKTKHQIVQEFKETKIYQKSGLPAFQAPDLFIIFSKKEKELTQLLRLLKKEQKTENIPVIIFSDLAEKELKFKVMGAYAYLSMEQHELLPTVISSIEVCPHYSSNDLWNKLSHAPGIDNLILRMEMMQEMKEEEYKIIKNIITNPKATVDKLAFICGMSKRTLENKLKNIYQKLRVGGYNHLKLLFCSKVEEEEEEKLRYGT